MGPLPQPGVWVVRSRSYRSPEAGSPDSHSAYHHRTMLGTTTTVAHGTDVWTVASGLGVALATLVLAYFTYKMARRRESLWPDSEGGYGDR